MGAGTALTAGVTLPLVAIGGAALKMGMDAVESENLVSVSFGDMTAAATAWSQNLSASLGLNQFELRKTAGTLYNMTSSMGLGKDAAFEMSTGVASLAADMASFRNIGMDEALVKIKAGLTGETEPLKAIGILVDENTTKTYAYKTGIAAQGAELTQQQKVMARWQAILAQTKNDQGDLARTLESPANQLRIMRTRVEEAATALGVSLMPVVQTVIGGVARVVPYIQSGVQWFAALPTPVKAGALAVGALFAALGPLVVVAGAVASGIGALLPAAAAVGGVLGGIAIGPVAAVVAGLGAVMYASKQATGSWFGFLAPLKGAWDLLKAVADLILTGTVVAVQTLYNWVKPLATVVGDALVFAFGVVVDWLNRFSAGLSWVASKIEGLVGWLKGSQQATADHAAAVAAAAAPTTAYGDATGALSAAMNAEAKAQGLAGAATAAATKEKKDAAKAAEEYRKKQKDIVDALTGKDAQTAMTQYMAAIRQIGDVQKMTADKQEDALKVLKEGIESYKRLGETVPPAAQQAYDALYRLVEIPKIQKEIAKLVSKGMADLADEYTKKAEEMTKAATKSLSEGLNAAKAATDEAAKIYMNDRELAIFEAEQKRDGQLAAIEPLRTQMPEVYASARAAIAQTFQQSVDDAKRMVDQQVGIFGRIGGQLGDTVIGAMQGGGSITKAVGGLFGKEMASSAEGPLMRGLGSLMSKSGLGTKAQEFLGNMVGSFIPGLGAIAGPLISKGLGVAAKGIGKLFGFGQSKSEKDAADTKSERDKWVEQQGGIEKVRALAESAGFSLDKMFNAKKPADFKAQVDALNASLQAQKDKIEGTATAVEGLNARAKGLGTTGTADELNRLSTYAQAAFGSMVQSGAGVVAAFTAIKPTLETIKAGLGSAGAESSATSQKMIGLYDTISKNEQSLAAVDALNQMMKGFGQAGLMNQDMITALGQDVTAEYAKMTAAGTTSNQAMALMQPTLQALWEGQQKYGAITDESTAALLRQAEEAGMVGEQQKGVNDKILDVLLAIGDALGAKIPTALQTLQKKTQETGDAFGDTGFGGKATKSLTGVELAAKTAAQNIGQAFGNIKVQPITVPYRFDAQNDLPGSPDIPAFANGGVVDRPTLAMVGDGGEREFIIPESKLGATMPGLPSTSKIGAGATQPLDLSEVSDAVAGLRSDMREDVPVSIARSVVVQLAKLGVV